MVKIILNGYLGHMGRVVTSLASKSKEVEIVAGIDTAPPKPASFPTFSDISDCDMPADVLLDFSTASIVPKILSHCAEKSLPAVICTTGLSEECCSQLLEISSKVGIFKSANMSIGINLVANILKRMSKLLLDEGFDAEILEKHHRLKIDAPSGTALFLADAIKGDRDYSYVYDRTDRRESRHNKEIGFSSVRGGSIVGEHSVIFAGRDEVIELRHEAFSKEVFAIGALNAVKFMKGKPAGLYTMQDIMDTL
ncbi:4-hydroxy-tetrahydrodipicolinate reductase [Clostridia bacterium]|nr:4-hydroxy-tetrahydrodipicolinate reductase [Clostridia bacterium]